MSKITLNRAPVLTLWSFIVAQRLGHSRDTALTLAKAVAEMSAFAKAKSLGLAEDRDAHVGARKRSRAANQKFIAFMGRRIPVLQSPSGPLAVHDGTPIVPKSVEKYLTAKFGDNYDAVHAAMVKLARSRSPAKLSLEAFHMYEAFRPTIPAGVAGWGKKGVLDLKKLDGMAEG